MSKIKDILAIAGVALLVGAVLWLACSVSYRAGLRHAPVVTDTVTVITERIDTVERIRPVYIAERVVDSVRIPVYLHDTTFVEVPITQKYYHEDSLYDAWVSGFLPQLDSISVYQKTRTVEVTKYVQLPGSPAPRWSLGVTAGPGLIYDGQGIHGGIGVVAGLQYRF